jgi:hypothetical protein
MRKLLKAAPGLVLMLLLVGVLVGGSFVANVATQSAPPQQDTLSSATAVDTTPNATVADVGSQVQTDGITLVGYHGKNLKKAKAFDAKFANRTFKLQTVKQVGVCVPAGSHKGSSHHQCFVKRRVGDGRWIICTEPYLQFLAVSVSLTDKPLRDLKAGASPVVKTLINHFLPTANTTDKAAALAFAAYRPSASTKYQLDKKGYAKHLGKTIVSMSNNEYGWAKSHKGPYHASKLVWDHNKVNLGEKNVGHFRVTAASGKPMPGLKAKFKCTSNTSVVSVSRTNARGNGTVTVRNKVNVGRHSCKGDIGHLPSGTRSLTGTPGSSFQQETSAPVYEHVHTSGFFANESVTVHAHSACKSGCDAIAVGKFTVENPAPAGTTVQRVRLHVDGKVVHTCYLKGGESCDLEKEVRDGAHFDGYDVCGYKGGQCVTPVVFHKRDKTFVCVGKPAMKVIQLMDCNCNGSLVPSPQSPAASQRTWKAWELKDGTRVTGSTVTLTNGQFTDLPEMNISGGHTYAVVVQTHAEGTTYTFTKDPTNMLSKWVETKS